MINNSASYTGVIGPSGVGKSFLCERIRSAKLIDGLPVKVFTTRQPRPNELGSNTRVFVTQDEFDQAVKVGKIVLPHRPFRGEETPLYGFDADDLATPKNRLLEVHSSIIASFRELIVERTLVIGVVADSDTLRRNIQSRQGSFNDGASEVQRLSMAQLEIEEIIEASRVGLVDAVFDYGEANRAKTETTVLDMVSSFVSGQDVRWAN